MKFKFLNVFEHGSESGHDYDYFVCLICLNIYFFDSMRVYIEGLHFIIIRSLNSFQKRALRHNWSQFAIRSGIGCPMTTTR